jgi:hypothetical protein
VIRLRAAIFSDGHAEGDSEFVEKLYAHRRRACQALAETIQLLTNVYTDYIPIAHITDLVSRKSNGGKTPDEGVGYGFVIFAMKRMLPHPPPTLRILSEALGQKPQLPAIEDVMQENGVTREEAGIFLFNKQLEAWKSLLETDMEPPE